MNREYNEQSEVFGEGLGFFFACVFLKKPLTGEAAVLERSRAKVTAAIEVIRPVTPYCAKVSF